MFCFSVRYLLQGGDVMQHFTSLSGVILRNTAFAFNKTFAASLIVLTPFSKIALVIIENSVRWLVENFVLSSDDYSNDGFQFSKWRPDLLMFRSRIIEQFKEILFYFLK